MQPVLANDDVAKLSRARALASSGQVSEAAAVIQTVSAAAGTHPDALFVAAEILKAQGNFANARRALEGALQSAPDNPHFWNAYANLLSEMGLHAEALRAFERVVKLAPNNAEFLIDQAMAADQAQQPDVADAALKEAQRHAPDAPRLWAFKGLRAHENGQFDTAIDDLSRAKRLAPGDAKVRHNLANALRSLDKLDDALEETEAALKAQPFPVTLTLRAHLLADLGRFEEAVQQYRDAIAITPALIDAQAMLARLMPQLGRKAEALDGFHEGLAAAPNDLDLWQAALVAAREVGDVDQFVRWSESAVRRFEGAPVFELARAMALEMVGKSGEAISELRHFAHRHPEEPSVHIQLARLLLIERDHIGAGEQALLATERLPFDQSGWAYLATAWRLGGDPREMWLTDYDRHVLRLDLELPPAFLPQFAATLTGLHKTVMHPAEQSLRGGTQTRGNLFDQRGSDIRILASTIQKQVERALANLPREQGHPFLGRLADGVKFVGSWSVRLASAGFHISHIHPLGWLSSAFYASLPVEVASKEGSTGQAPGALVFGVPDETLGLDLPPRRIEVPVEGRLVLFPSYFWHGTVPFESTSPRLTVAFDALPVVKPAHAV